MNARLLAILVLFVGFAPVWAQDPTDLDLNLGIEEVPETAADSLKGAVPQEKEIPQLKAAPEAEKPIIIPLRICTSPKAGLLRGFLTGSFIRDRKAFQSPRQLFRCQVSLMIHPHPGKAVFIILPASLHFSTIAQAGQALMIFLSSSSSFIIRCMSHIRYSFIANANTSLNVSHPFLRYIFSSFAE